jgi:hypothetical protein
VLFQLKETVVVISLIEGMSNSDKSFLIESKHRQTIMDKDILSLIEKKGFPQSFYDFCVFVKENDMTIAKEEKPVKEQDVIGAIVTCRRKRKKQKAEAERLRALLENYRE